MKKNLPLVKISKVNKSFARKIVIDNLSLEVQKGEIFGFIGPNGAGKTTTIRLLLDILRPDQGQIILFGRSNSDIQTVHQRIGYMSAELALDNDLSGQQYLGFINNIYGGKHLIRIKELADKLDLDLKIKINNYSRGNRQKVALISALFHEPDLLILDEPTSGFDPLVQEVFMDLMKTYRENGGTVFMSSHILSEVQKLCDRIGFIKDGQLIGITSIENLQQNSARIFNIKVKPRLLTKLKSEITSIKEATIISAKTSEIKFTYSGTVKPILKLLANYDVTDLLIQEPELEDIFVNYYQNK